VEEHLSENDSRYVMYRTVFRELGFSRNPSAEEKRIMNAWFDELRAGLDEVLEACRKTSGISNPNIRYVDRVLRAKAEEKAAAKAAPGGGEKEDLFARVGRLYERQRAESEAKAEEAKRLVFSKVPRIKDIMDEMRDCGFRISAAMLKGAAGRSEIERERGRFAKLAEEKAALLAEAGLPADATDIKYNCARCKDTGLLEDGTRCGCFSEKLKQLSEEDARGKDEG
jgi:hypothetical protein